MRELIDCTKVAEHDMSLQCSTCPDPPNCARLLEEKWKQAYHAVFRFGMCTLVIPSACH